MKQRVHIPLLEQSLRNPGRVAIVCDHEQVTYAEFVGEIRRLTSLLAHGGIHPGDRVLLYISHKVDFLVACYAVMASGGIAVPLHAGSSRATVVQSIAACNPTFILAGEDDLSTVPIPPLKTNLLLLRRRARNDGRLAYIVHDEEIVAGRGEALNTSVHPEDDAIILYTSGTSGRKKGVVLSHQALLQATVNINMFMNIDPEIREYVSIPLTHSFGFGRARCVFQVGGTIVLSNGFLNPVSMAEAIWDHQCNAFSAVPSVVAMFFARHEDLLHRVGSRIRFIELGSAPMPIEHKLKMLDMFPTARICMHYGLTEASRSTFIEMRSEQDKLDTIGKPSPGVQVAILDSDGNRLAAGEKGEICVRGGHTLTRYWNDPLLSKESFTNDGWFKTGDYGFSDEQGYLTLWGRKDDIINMGGIKISPQEIEEPIKSLLPSVDFCVVGVPDPAGIAGEIPVLCYVPSPEVRIEENKLLRDLSKHVDRFKVPRLVVSLDQLPKTDNEKVKRQEVREMLTNRLSPELQGGIS